MTRDEIEEQFASFQKEMAGVEYLGERVEDWTLDYVSGKGWRVQTLLGRTPVSGARHQATAFVEMLAFATMALRLKRMRSEEGQVLSEFGWLLLIGACTAAIGFQMLRGLWS